MKILHERGTKTVVITSSELGDDDTLIALGSTMNDGECKRTVIFYSILKMSETFVEYQDVTRIRKKHPFGKI